MTELLKYIDNKIEFINKYKDDDFEKCLSQIYENDVSILRKQLEDTKMTRDLIYAKYLARTYQYEISPYKIIKTYYLNKSNKEIFGDFMNQNCKNPEDSVWKDYFNFNYKYFGSSNCRASLDPFTVCENCEFILQILKEFALDD